MPAKLSAGVIGLYLVLMGLLAYLGSERLLNALVAEALVAALVLYLGRYLSTRYRLTHYSFMALRLFGSRRIPLEEIRHASHASLRDLAPVSFIGSWGWRGRMWSPRMGHFDTVHTTSEGLLISGGEGVPVFISPQDPDAFLAELSRRVRSYNPDIDIETTAG
ncbi:MAG: PH domain-containing protein [Thermoplasmata archaeon]